MLVIEEGSSFPSSVSCLTKPLDVKLVCEVGGSVVGLGPYSVGSVLTPGDLSELSYRTHPVVCVQRGGASDGAGKTLTHECQK